MLYPKNKAEKLALSLFQNPGSEYRGTPFWSWNCKMDEGIALRQIGYLKEMGLGGFHMHSRTGMAMEYLGGEYMALVKACVDKAEQENMLAWLYDEDRWPSGFAGGLVTRDPRYRCRHLVFTPEPMGGTAEKEEAGATGKPYLLARYDVTLDGDGTLAAYRRLAPGEKATGTLWHAYVATGEQSPWWNNETYVDTLNPDAIDRFIEITYDAYKDAVGDRFGTVIPAIFTDEPQFTRKEHLGFAAERKPVAVPWTDDFPDTFRAGTGLDVVAHLPELFWDLPQKQVSRVRYLYHDQIAERFARAFADRCGAWCEKNNLMLTGHMMEESTLYSQTAALGEAMRSYRGFQLPGIDMLCDHVELTTAKQAQSASRQYGRAGVLSELYGVTNWDFDFRGHKFQGDWQAALGVTVRVQHLSWVSMEGEAKRDYPASISYQSPWFREYPYVEDHFARLGTALTRGKAVCRVAVVHPVESYWLHWGPNQSTGAIREQMDGQFQSLTAWLLLGQIDFDYLSESLLPSLCKEGGAPLRVGEMAYDAVVVPPVETLRESTRTRLEQFQKAGGTLIFTGECPGYVDAAASQAVRPLYERAKRVPFSRIAILEALAPFREVRIDNANGTHAGNFIYTMRQDTDCRWLFIAQGKKRAQADVTRGQEVLIRVPGTYAVEVYDTLTGEVRRAAFTAGADGTVVEETLHCHDSLLLKLTPAAPCAGQARRTQRKAVRTVDFKGKVPYTLAEPNVLLLDQFEYSFDGGEFFPQEDVLIADNKFREALGLPLRGNDVAQPWVLEEKPLEHTMTVRYVIHSEAYVASPVLALENPETVSIRFNGREVSSKPAGYYVDEAIKTVPLPDIAPGDSVIELAIPFGERANVESCYLLGDFSVRVEGTVKTLLPPTKEIAFSSATTQGLPFYGGNITYRTQIDTPACDLRVTASYYRGAMIKVLVDGAVAGVIAYAPYSVEIPGVTAGKHTVEFVLFGNRHNTFGSLHNVDTANEWFGPNHWRSTKDAWAYEYQLKDTGIMKSPVIEILASNE